MKKNILLAVFIMLNSVSFSQSNDKLFKAIENSKSGNYKDILASFLQLASKNNETDGKSLELNSTLFSIKSKVNPDLLIDYNLKKETFSRNFQFNFKLDLDKDYKYKGFAGGFTYAIVNGRDKQLAVLTNTTYYKKYEVYRKTVDSIQRELILANTDDKVIIDKAVTDIRNNKPTDNKSNKYYQIFSDKFNERIHKRKDVDSDSDLKKYNTTLDSLVKVEYQRIDAKPLWTVSADGTANTDGKFNKASFGTIFLVGNQQAWNEIDLRAKVTYTDTLQTQHLPRTGFNAKAGMNFKLGKDLNQKSFFEVKIYGEYNAVFNNLTPDEKKNDFLANADIRVRLTDDLWILRVLPKRSSTRDSSSWIP